MMFSTLRSLAVGCRQPLNRRVALRGALAGALLLGSLPTAHAGYFRFTVSYSGSVYGGIKGTNDYSYSYNRVSTLKINGVDLPQNGIAPTFLPSQPNTPFMTYTPGMPWSLPDSYPVTFGWWGRMDLATLPSQTFSGNGSGSLEVALNSMTTYVGDDHATYSLTDDADNGSPSPNPPVRMEVTCTWVDDPNDPNDQCPTGTVTLRGRVKSEDNSAAMVYAWAGGMSSDWADITVAHLGKVWVWSDLNQGALSNFLRHTRMTGGGTSVLNDVPMKTIFWRADNGPGSNSISYQLTQEPQNSSPSSPINVGPGFISASRTFYCSWNRYNHVKRMRRTGPPTSASSHVKLTFFVDATVPGGSTGPTGPGGGPTGPGGGYYPPYRP